MNVVWPLLLSFAFEGGSHLSILSEYWGPPLATIPLPPGDYDFTLRVRTADGRARDEYTFRFHAGDGSSGVIR